MRQQGFFFIQNLSRRHYKKSLTMKKTTNIDNIDKIKKLIRKMREESVGVIETISISLKPL